MCREVARSVTCLGPSIPSSIAMTGPFVDRVSEESVVITDGEFGGFGGLVERAIGRI